MLTKNKDSIRYVPTCIDHNIFIIYLQFTVVITFRIGEQSRKGQ